MDEVLSSRYSSLPSGSDRSTVQTITGTFALQLQHLFLTFLRPALIRSELRTALRRCPTEEAAGSVAPEQPVGQLQSLIAQRMQRAQELLEEMRLQVRCSLEVSLKLNEKVLNLLVTHRSCRRQKRSVSEAAPHLT